MEYNQRKGRKPGMPALNKLRATHRVVNNDGKTIGFIINNEFYPDYTVYSELQSIENLELEEKDSIREKNGLPRIKYSELNGIKYKQLSEENPFQRDIQTDLLEWKEDPMHVVLQLEGTRQVGKTTELLKFAYKNYEYLIYVNAADDIYGFASVLKSPRMVSAMQEYCRTAGLPEFVNDKNTILIIDEIQNSYNIYNSIRRMYSTFKCDIVITGSYLGRILGNRDFFLPAGTIEKRYLFTLSFREFCRVYKKEKILDNIDLHGRGNNGDYTALEELYQLYVKIGGYPEVIKRYRQTKSISICYETIHKLLVTFKEESRNYFDGDRDVEIFDSVYREALKEMCFEKRGTGRNIIDTVTKLSKENTDLLVNKNEIARAVIWLQYTGIISTSDLAVNGDIKNIAPGRRIYFSDCGLASYLASQSPLNESALAGLITETFIFNELHRLFRVRVSMRKVRGDNVCFSVYEDYELDFMVMAKDRIIYGIEGKTKDGTTISLKVFKDRNFIDKGIIAKNTHGGGGDIFGSIPVYTVGCRFPYN